MSLLAMSFGEIGSASIERAGQGEVGWCTWKVHTAWLSLGSALKTPWLALDGLILSYAQRAEKTVLSLCWTPIPDSEAFFPVWSSSCWPGAVTISSSLMVGCDLSHECVEDGCNGNCATFGGWKPDKTGDMQKWLPQKDKSSSNGLNSRLFPPDSISQFSTQNSTLGPLHSWMNHEQLFSRMEKFWPTRLKQQKIK